MCIGELLRKRGVGYYRRELRIDPRTLDDVVEVRGPYPSEKKADPFMGSNMGFPLGMVRHVSFKFKRPEGAVEPKSEELEDFR